jgi:hypothetical protein
MDLSIATSAEDLVVGLMVGAVLFCRRKIQRQKQLALCGVTAESMWLP